MNELRVERYDPQRADEVLAVINDAFASPRSEEWFTWKHLDGPWGPSRGVVATDDRGMTGVRLLLPWKLARGNDSILAYRAVEASTARRARGQGVFSALNRAVMEELENRDESSFVFSTPNQLSREGYRKLGWTWLDPVPHKFGFVPVRTMAFSEDLLQGEAALGTYRPPPLATQHLRTAWTPEALRWRFDQRSGNRYQAVASKEGDLPGGLVYRIVKMVGQRRALLLLLDWGPPGMVRRLLGEAARREGVRITLDVDTRGEKQRLGVRRGQSLIATWSPDERLATTWSINDIHRWWPTFADLESVL